MTREDSALPILTEQRSDGIVVITINRPHRANAFDGPAAQAMEAALDRLDADPTARCAILTGAGSVFCAGQDLKAAATGDFASTSRRGVFGFLKTPPTKPIIAAVEGHALGGGLELCLGCDLVVASTTAMMGLPEVSRSVLALGGGLFRLPRRIPYHLAMELALTGKPWPATEFHRLGLVNRLCQPGQALQVALELAAEVLAGAPLAVQASKQIMRQAADWSEAESWSAQLEFAKPIHRSADLREGLLAFSEKRAPVWSGQ